MVYQFKSYLKFLRRSTNAHGIHSPFVYDLVTQCFYDKKQYSHYQLLKEHRRQLLNSAETIEITDFGKGSRIFKGNQRRVAKIVTHAGIQPKRQRLLYRLVRYFSSETILELGTSVGLATTALALGNKDGRVITVEGCPNTSEVAETYFKQFKLTNIELITSTFESFFEANQQPAFDLVYIDGNHSKEHTLQYFHTLLPLIHNDSVLIFDDIYWSESMTQAWEVICAHAEVTVSIDSFYWGLIFFRKEQPKQHFKIRL